MNKGMLELMAEKVHNSWMAEKKKQEFHHPSKCPVKTEGCVRCHNDIKPYKDLTEKVKELDRVMVKEFEKNLNQVGGYVTFPNSLRYISKRASDDLQEFGKYLLGNLKNGHDIVDLFWYWHEEHRVMGLEVYCPHCGWDKDGFTKFEGRIIHACDPGCCCTLACSKCGRVYGLSEDKDQKYNLKSGIVVDKKQRIKKKLAKLRKKRKKK